MVWHTVPSFVQKLFPSRVWTKAAESNEVYLTFDDGPVPGITDFVLAELQKRGMKATFFMVGDNVRKFPELAKEVFSQGHRIGNHTFHHLNGWRTESSQYFADIKRCDDTLEEMTGVKPNIFRPPYGLIKSAQAKEVLKEKQVVMWDVLSGDYHPKISTKLVLENTMKYTQAGSIVLFHDQQKTESILPRVLPGYLDFVLDQNLRTETL